MSTVTFGTGPFSEGQVYLGSNGVNYVYENGCFNLSKPADIDTVDGYSEQGISDGTNLDSDGNLIPAGLAVVNYFDSQGNYLNSLDTTKTVGSSTTQVTGGNLVTTSDGGSTFVCDQQSKGLRNNGDGTWTETFVNQDGEISDGETLDINHTGEVILSAVDADGNTTYVDADGATQTIAAVDLNGDPVDPSQAVWNMIDGDGNYLGSKPCEFKSPEGAGVFWPTGLVFPEGTCPPVDPPSVDQSAITVDPDGRVWEFAVGIGWNLRTVDEISSGATANGATNITDFLVNSVAGDEFTLDVCHPPVENTNKCRSITCETRHQTAGGLYIGLTNDWVIKETTYQSTDGGTTWVLIQSGYVDTRGLSQNTIQSGSPMFNMQTGNSGQSIAAGDTGGGVCTRVVVSVEIKGTSVVNANITNTQSGVFCHAD